MIYPLPETQETNPPSPNWWGRWAVALLVGGLVGLVVWWGDGPFLSTFIMGVLFILSSLKISDDECTLGASARAGNWLQLLCRYWRCTRRGILFYRTDKPAPSLMLPWESLESARLLDDNILVEDEENDTLYALPIDAAQRDSVLAHIQQQIAEHKTESQEEDSYEKSVFFMHSPHCLSKWCYVKVSSPWLVVGLLSPFIWPDEMFTSALFFALGVCMGLSWLSEIEDRFCTENYMGEETRRSKRGVSIRMSRGIRCFIPWACMAEATAMLTDCTFLCLKESQDGICLNGQDNSLPIPITRRYLNSRSWIRMTVGVVCVLVAAIAGIIWYQLWQ
ncbi:MAG: hypothetical protein UHH87_05760 [Akkermansia sp.]|nr:hypothetical protein [Akkermansia sp.]